MTRTIVTRTINAPADLVFNTISDIGQFSKALPNIVGVEFLSDIKTGVGTRFRETRLMGGKPATTELEVTEYVANDYVRLVSDTSGTIWDTIFTVRRVGEQTQLEMVMDARAYKLVSRLMNPLFKGYIKRAIESDMDAVKVYCEK